MENPQSRKTLNGEETYTEPSEQERARILKQKQCYDKTVEVKGEDEREEQC